VLVGIPMMSLPGPPPTHETRSFPLLKMFAPFGAEHLQPLG